MRRVDQLSGIYGADFAGMVRRVMGRLRLKEGDIFGTVRMASFLENKLR